MYYFERTVYVIFLRSSTDRLECTTKVRTNRNLMLMQN